jgi:5-formyltetrahydrofolate cyclo-ligase
LEELSLPVIARLRPRLVEAQTILAYYSLPDEVCTRQLIDELIADGKTVLLPKVLDAGRMELRRYTGPHDLTEGAYGIMEPVGEPFTDYALIDIALIPGMAFDAAGHRLGRGRGYYDRFLSLLIPPSSLLLPRFFGLCFDFQKVDTVPSDDHDIPVDIVI